MRTPRPLFLLCAVAIWAGAGPRAPAQCGGHEQEKLVPASGDPSNIFGASIDLQWPVAVIGEPGNRHAGAATGAVHVYRRNGSFWNIVELHASDGYRTWVRP